MSQLTLYNGPDRLQARPKPRRQRPFLHSSFFLLHFPSPAPRNCGRSGSRGDCRLKAATQERRLQAADELHNPANRLTPSATAATEAGGINR